MPLPTSTELSDQLFRAAEARASQHGLRFGIGADNDLHSLAQIAADKILATAQSKPVNEAGPYVRGATRVASEAMATVVDEMTSARFKISGYAVSNPDTIGEDTLREALKILCPLWPICD